MPLDTAIRLFVIGQEILIAAVFLAGDGGRAARVSGALFMMSLAGYLFTSDEYLVSSLAVLAPFAVLLALLVPYCLWVFARAIFEAPWPRPVWLGVCGVVVISVWTIFLAGDALSSLWLRLSSIVMHVVGLAVVAHALWLAAKGRPDDLIENRRSFRVFFVVIISIQASAVLGVELAFGGSTLPAWLDLANVIVIAVLTVGLATPMLNLSPAFFEAQARSGPEGVVPNVAVLGAAERVLRGKLLDSMNDGYYRETGLTISALAEKLGYPEHQLRRLINGHLGYRNFSEFLNSYRIAEAKNHLADPDRARTPVLTIALDLGYASLGPFNRAFKVATGATPTEFRHQNVQHSSADSE